MDEDKGTSIERDPRAVLAPDSANGELDRTFVAPRDQLERQLTQIWEQVLDIHTVGVRDNFFELVAGRYQDSRLIDHVSFRAAAICNEIHASVGQALPVATLLLAPTVEHMADLLRQEAPALPWSSLVAIKPRGARPPFFMVHGAGAHVNFAYFLAHRLGPDQPFYGLQSRGLDGKQPPHARVEDMAAHYILEMRTVQPEGPYYVGGRSLGGLIAFEIAQQLHKEGDEVALLVLFDAYLPGHRSGFRDTRSLGERNRVNFHLGNLKGLRPKGVLTYILERARSVTGREKRRLGRRTWAVASGFYQGLGRPLPRSLQNVKRSNHQAHSKYVPRVYPGKATLFRCRIQPKRFESSSDFGWGGVTAGRLEIHEVPGAHASMYYEPHVDALAEKLGACLVRARDEVQRR